MRAVPLLVLLAACGASTTKPIENTASPPPDATRIACPTGSELEELARATWKATGGTATAHCTAFRRADEALWLVEGRIDRDGPDGRTVDFHAAILGARDHRVVRIEIDPGHPWTANGVEYEVADLDADGTDELIEVQTIRDDLHIEQSLSINHVQPEDPQHATLPLDGSPSMALSDDWKVAGSLSTLGSCTSTHRVIQGPDRTSLLEVVGTNDGHDQNAACPKPGRHVYKWNGQELEEVSP